MIFFKVMMKCKIFSRQLRSILTQLKFLAQFLHSGFSQLIS